MTLGLLVLLLPVAAVAADAGLAAAHAKARRPARAALWVALAAWVVVVPVQLASPSESDLAGDRPLTATELAPAGAPLLLSAALLLVRPPLLLRVAAWAVAVLALGWAVLLGLGWGLWLVPAAALQLAAAAVQPSRTAVPRPPAATLARAGAVRPG